MKTFLNNYFTTYKFQGMTVEKMKAFLIEQTNTCLGEEKAKEALDKIDWELWIEKSGNPPVDPKFEELAPEIQVAKDLATKYADTGAITPEEITAFADWYWGLKGIFLQQLLDIRAADEADEEKTQRITLELVQKIDTDLKLTETLVNPELINLWYPLALYVQDPNVETKAKEFLHKFGRAKFLVPSYSALNSVQPEKAVSWFRERESWYHPIARESLYKALGIGPASQFEELTE